MIIVSNLLIKLVHLLNIIGLWFSEQQMDIQPLIYVNYPASSFKVNN